MKVLVLDASLDSLITLSAAQHFSDFVFTLLLSSESRHIDWSSAFSAEVTYAYRCIKDIPLTVDLLKSRDASAYGCFKEAFSANSPKDSTLTVDDALTSLLRVLDDVPVRPLLLDLESTAYAALPIFGCNTVLEHYVSHYGSSLVEKTCSRDSTTISANFNLIFWASQLRPLCRRFDTDSVKELLLSLEDHLSSTKYISGSNLPIEAVVVTFSLLWYINRLKFLGLDLDMFPLIKRFVSSVLTSVGTSKVHWCLRRYHEFHEEAANAVPPTNQTGALYNVCKDLIGKKFYATAALAYTNGPPHIGHTYEIAASDILVRYFNVFGMDTTFMTGTDEHGLKVATTAENSGMFPIELADFYSSKFRENNARLQATVDLFLRTTEPRHYKCARKVWRQLRDRGDIYLGEYSGWYNVREETFVTEVEAASTDYKDPLSGKPYTLMKESSYFFRMSKYQQQLIDKISNDPSYVQPDSARSEILSRLKKPLEDLSVSRCNFKWGIPVPDDPGHVMYVWCDALIGYLSAIGFGDHDNIEQLKLWSPDIQVIGKDILWFHSVIWSSILMSLGIPLPKTIFAHGFITAGDGRKMSKSLGNVVDTKPLLATFGADSLRYYMIRDSVFGCDVKLDVSAMTDLHNADLTDNIGNLVHRITTLCVKFCDGCIPRVADKSAVRPFDMVHVASRTLKHLQGFALQDALISVVEAFRDTNKYVTDREPWAKSAANTRDDTIRNVLEAVYFLTHLMQPVIPSAAAVIFKKLNTEPRRHIGLLSSEYDNLTEGRRVHVGDILFHKVGDASKRS